MRFLLDTHTLIWFLIDDPRLSKQAAELICEAENEPLSSMASLWEIAIKSSLGKLVLKKAFDDLFPRELTKNGIGVLAIDIDHLSVSTALPFHHRDPFDRLIIAQAIAEGLPILGNDSEFHNYPVEMVW